MPTIRNMPTIRMIIDVFNQYKNLFIDQSNCIMLIKLEEFLANEYDIEYGTESYADLEDGCYKAYLILMKQGNYNE